jgi:hydroxypyruvate isomerase
MALTETGLKMLGLNTHRGEPGENGLSALPGREDEARAAVDQALAYAQVTKTPNVHVMAGFAKGPDAEAAFIKTLRYACEKAGDKTILIEPLNQYDAPGYFLQSTAQAEKIIADVGAPNLKLMFDCYHVQLTEGDVTNALERLQPIIGHVQVASVPDRGAPDHGELSYPHIWEVLSRIGWDAPIGAEYKPGGDTDATLGWLKEHQT